VNLSFNLLIHIRKVQAAPKPLTDQANDGALLLFN
jgi:hypothetical protein